MKELQNGQLWYDTDGNVLHAHGGHMLAAEDGYYYWYGEDRTEGNYVSVYRSKDLVNWEFRRHCLTVASPVEPTRVRARMELYFEVDDATYEKVLNRSYGVPSAMIYNGKKITKINVERPKVLYCKKTGKYVMWAHYENGNDYLDAACLVATCDTPDGDFVYHGAFNPFGEMSRDCTLFLDDDGTAYFASASRDNADLHIYTLAPDFLNVSRFVNNLYSGEYREAPAIYKKDGRYYMLSSYCTGWAPNQGKWSTADRMDGEWSLLEDFGDGTTYLSQPAFVLQKDGRDIYIGDRWGGDGMKYFGSTYIVLDIKYDEAGNPYINYTDRAEF